MSSQENIILDTVHWSNTRLEAAPDGSVVALLPRTDGMSVCHVSLAPGGVSQAVRHRTISEVWTFIAGRGDLWRRLDGHEQTVMVERGVAVSIPAGCLFQFRNTGEQPLEFICATCPCWPGEGEAMIETGPWATQLPSEK